MTSTPQALLRRRRTPSRRTGMAMAAESVTFALASTVHFATGFTRAAIPELVIAAVLGVGSSAALTRRAHAWGIAVGTTAFATFGTILGLTIIATGRQACRTSPTTHRSWRRSWPHSSSSSAGTAARGLRELQRVTGGVVARRVRPR